MDELADPIAVPMQRRSPLRTGLSLLRIVVFNSLIFAVLAELVCFFYINNTNWPSSKPNYHLTYNLFWADINPVFGVWHRPNSHFIHKAGCYTVEYTTNSYGARDVERNPVSSQPRTIVLGDSFIEGMGIPDGERLTDILERDTGREHLNFGTGGNFGPLQYALLYKSMAANFNHNLVIVGVLPDNDFHDMSLSWGKAHQPSRYRPYYADDFSIVYEGRFQPNAGEGTWDHIEAALRAYFASYHVGQYIYSRLNSYSRNPYSGYNDYTEVDLAHLKRALQDIKTTAAAHGARAAVFLIPRANDFLRLHQSGANRLGPIMENWGTEIGIPVKDLLPDMEALSHGDFRPYFLACDGHWSPHGDAVAASILEPWLESAVTK